MQVRNDPQKWANRSSAAAGDYASGVQSPRRPWAASAAAAADVQAAAIQEAIAEGRYEKGVNKAGDSAWSNGVQNKGRTRYQQGVTVAQNKYQSGFAPYAATLSSMTLSPRGPKGQNYNRVQEVGDALRNAKKSQ